MSKKLLASLIALTMVSAYACGGDDDKDDKGSSCTLGEISCVDGATAIKVCNNKGEWLDTTCSAYKQDVPNGVCQSNNCVTSGTTPLNPPTGECTNGAYQCTGQDLYQCVNQAWSKAKTCGANQECDATLQDCKDKETPGPGPQDEACTKESYTPSCAADGLSGSYCGNKGTVVTVTCTADKPCVNNDGFIKCDDGSSSGNLEACKMEKDADCTACQVVCAADNSKGYYCNTKTGKMVEKTCANNDCSVDGNSLNCGSSSSGGGEACTKESYTPSCAADGLSGSYCGNKGTVVTVTCTADKPCVNNDGYIKCGGSSSTELPADIPATCTKGDKGICGSDGMPYICGDSGYYKGKCDGTCFECGDGYWVACGATEAAACKDHEKPAETCTYGSYAAKCDGDVATYCAFGDKLNTQTCAAGKCTLCADGYVGCDVDCSKDGHDVKCTGDTKLTTGGNEGDCCDVAKYKPVCDGKTSVTYCSSVGKVKTKACGNTCSVASDNKYTCK